jgi:RNA polymerase primary sigma factor
MIDALQDRENVELEEETPNAPAIIDDEEPDRKTLEAVEREEKEKASAEDYEDFSMDAIKLYLKDIQKTNLLTAEEERALARRIDDGDMDARNQMIESNLRLVVKIAKRYMNRRRQPGPDQSR